MRKSHLLPLKQVLSTTAAHSLPYWEGSRIGAAENLPGDMLLLFPTVPGAGVRPRPPSCHQRKTRSGAPAISLFQLRNLEGLRGS